MNKTQNLLQVSPIKEMYKFLFLVSYIGNMGFQLFIPCYYGSILSYRSSELPDSVFKSNWTEQSRRFKSALTIFIRCAQKPVVLYTVKRTFAIALPTFATVKIMPIVLFIDSSMPQCILSRYEKLCFKRKFLQCDYS